MGRAEGFGTVRCTISQPRGLSQTNAFEAQYLMSRGFDSHEPKGNLEHIPKGRVPDEPQFRWINWKLEKSPVAIGGEPCLYCGNQISAETSPTHRRRHLCSARCNSLARRRIQRRQEKGLEPEWDVDALKWPDVKDEMAREPGMFKTLLDAEFPFEHPRWPKPGDVIERFGHHTEYFAVHSLEDIHRDLRDLAKQVDPELTRLVGIRHRESGVEGFMKTYATGMPTRLLSPTAGFQMVPEELAVFHQEQILSVDRFGIPFFWFVPLFTPFPMGKMYSADRLKFNEKSVRAHKARSAYRARLRTLGVLEAEADYVDPFDVYERDQWLCQICGGEIDRNSKWPKPYAPSLDHVVPVSQGGTHEIFNLQATHLACNLSKGCS